MSLLCLSFIDISLRCAAAVTAVAGLSIASAPDVAHYFPFFNRLTTGNIVGSGVATGLAAVVAATIFVSIGMWVVKREYHYPISSSQEKS